MVAILVCWQDHWTHFFKLDTPWSLWPSLVKFGPVVSEEKIFVKVNDNRCRATTATKWWEMLAWPFRPGELKRRCGMIAKETIVHKRPRSSDYMTCDDHWCFVHVVWSCISISIHISLMIFLGLLITVELLLFLWYHFLWVWGKANHELRCTTFINSFISIGFYAAFDKTTNSNTHEYMQVSLIQQKLVPENEWIHSGHGSQFTDLHG